MRSNLIDAIKSHNKAFIEGYLETISIDALMDDLRALIDGNESGDDLKAFTMAAMKGLLSASWYTDESMHGQLAKAAVSAARATLNELQKQQP